MTVGKKKQVARKIVKLKPKITPDVPPEGNLDIFFGWLNEKYGTKLPRLTECPAKSTTRDLLIKTIRYEKVPEGIMYKARILGEVTVLENVLLSGFVVEIEQIFDSQPKNYQIPTIQFYIRRTRKQRKKKEKCYD